MLPTDIMASMAIRFAVLLIIIFMVAAPLGQRRHQGQPAHPEQGVLLDAVTVYANVIANQGLVEAQRINVTLLREMLATTKRGSTPAT